MLTLLQMLFLVTAISHNCNFIKKFNFFRNCDFISNNYDFISHKCDYFLQM